LARIGVALSGGVDSSVAAWILKEQGHQVVGLTLQMDRGDSGAWRAGREVAEQLDIIHLVVPAQREFTRQVVEPMVAAYADGKTPNPCARCNALVKFPLLWQAAQAQGCQALATGHYASLEQAGQQFFLAEAADLKKSQAYFLARLTQDMLGRLKFPLAGFKKDQVRKTALDAGLKTASRKESQDLCFLPSEGLDGLMRDYGGVRPGLLEDEQGRILGRHQGLHRFTIGQRRGLGVALGAPRYVLALDGARAAVRLGPQTGLWARGLVAGDALWYETPREGQDLQIRCRYNHKGVGGRVFPQADEVQVEFDQPVRAVAPGQLAVFSTDRRVVGSAWIEEAVF